MKVYAVALLCVAVVLLSVSAKVSLYSCLQSQPNVASHGAHLLTADQKMEVRSMPVFMPALWLTALLLPLVAIATHGEIAAIDLPLTRTLSGFARERFERPPPSL